MRERPMYRCPDPDCDAAFLTELQLRGHKSTHADGPEVFAR